MKRLPGVLMLLGLLMAGCSDATHTIATPVPAGPGIKLGAIWNTLAAELKVDPQHPANIVKFWGEVDPDGSLRSYVLEVQATPLKSNHEVLFQVEGGTSRRAWTWWRFVEQPEPVQHAWPAADFFAALDRPGFPDAYVQPLGAADFYTFSADPDVGPAQNAIQLTLAQGQLRPWQASDRAENELRPVLYVRAMKPSGTNTWSADRQVAVWVMQ